MNQDEHSPYSGQASEARQAQGLSRRGVQAGDRGQGVGSSIAQRATSALPLPRRRSAQKYRLGRVSRTPVHTLPIKGPQIKGCEVGRTGPPSLHEELRADSHQGNPPPYPCHLQSNIWLCSSHRNRFSSLSRKERVPSRRKTSVVVSTTRLAVPCNTYSYKHNGNALWSYKTLRLSNFVTSLLLKLCVHLCVLGEVTSAGLHQMRTKHPSQPQPS